MRSAVKRYRAAMNWNWPPNWKCSRDSRIFSKNSITTLNWPCVNSISEWLMLEEVVWLLSTEIIHLSPHQVEFQRQICPFTRLATAENVRFHTSRVSRMNYASLSISVGELNVLAIRFQSTKQWAHFTTMYSLFRSRNADFRDHVISHYDGLPEIGTVFAILVEKKYFRAIRTHSEVCVMDILLLVTRVPTTIRQN